ncbi:hypothetical protein [Solirhodobacter olei]|uniref:hypothetical protein n=1 Tax=Solirhodobacter olei TaxID=2493082 RepID=UPI000FDB526C|nr:hypothetical protein [Solirhodobacter olei]
MTGPELPFTLDKDAAVQLTEAVIRRTRRVRRWRNSPITKLALLIPIKVLWCSPYFFRAATATHRHPRKDHSRMTSPVHSPSRSHPHNTVLEAAQAALGASLQRIDTVCDTLEAARAFCREVSPEPNVDTHLLPLWICALEEHLIEVDTLATNLDAASEDLEKNLSPIVTLEEFHPPVRDAITRVLARNPASPAPGTSRITDPAHAHCTRDQMRNNARG